MSNSTEKTDFLVWRPNVDIARRIKADQVLVSDVGALEFYSGAGKAQQLVEAFAPGSWDRLSRVPSAEPRQ